MSERVRYHTVSLASGATNTGTIEVGDHKTVMMYISAVSASFGVASMTAVIRGAYDSGISGNNMHYYDYGNATTKQCQITVPTAGFYELPTLGCPYINVQFTTIATAGGTEKVYFTVTDDD